jgi:arylsulfatase
MNLTPIKSKSKFLQYGLLLLLATASAQAQDKKPNILLIIADDMGYSDISCFGGEVQTPHIDALAKSGIRATNFYVAPTCSPTRSMLLSGCDHHVAGLGNMEELVGPEQKGKPGYEGYLNARVVPVAKVLKEAGYHTYWAGKSHMGYEPSQWPAAMGFERDFALLQGGGSNWSDMTYPHPPPQPRPPASHLHPQRQTFRETPRRSLFLGGLHRLHHQEQRGAQGGW